MAGYGETNASEVVNRSVEWVTVHLVSILLVGTLLMLVIAGFVILLNWLGSRGQMMFIRAVALNDPRIGENWRQTGPSAYSLFLFRLALVAAGFVIGAVILAAGAAIVVTQAARGEESLVPYLLALLPLMLAAGCIGLVFWLVHTFLRNLVAPLMFQFDLRCLQAWGEFSAIARANILPLLLFLIIRFGYWIIIMAISLFIGCMTCCVGFLPVIFQTLTAPLHVFDRAYSLYVLESLGPEFQIIQPPEPLPDVVAEELDAMGPVSPTLDSEDETQYPPEDEE